MSALVKNPFQYPFISSFAALLHDSGGTATIGPYPMQATPDLLVADLYVDSSATGAGDGSSWTDAFTTIGAAITAASADDIIEISGGSSGVTYTADLAVNKAVTLQGSNESGHDQTVTIHGRVTCSNTTSTIYIKGVDLTVTQAYREPIKLDNNSSVQFDDVNLGPFTVSSRNPIIYGGTHVFNRCVFYHSKRTDGVAYGLYGSSNACDLTFNYCIFDHYGKIYVKVSGTSLLFNKCLILADGITGVPSGSSSYVDVGNDASNSAEFNRTAFFGVHPVASGANSVITVDHCFWHHGPGLEGVGGLAGTFDTEGVAVLTNCLGPNTLPYFTTPRNTTMGEYILRYDDRNELDASNTAIQTLNPEIVLTHSVNLHGRVSGSRPSAQEIDYMRLLLAGGNEVGSHSATHSDNSTLDTLVISATGTSPTLDISTTQSGDSTTWSGSLTITINSAPSVIDLSSASYSSLGLLVAELDGLSVGDGTVTCAKATTGSGHSDSTFSLSLADVTGQSISSSYTAQMDDDAFLRYEVEEAILDLEAYILTGSDRNSANTVTGMSEDAPSSYTCKSYAAPYGEHRSSITAALADHANIICANGGVDSVESDGKLYEYGDADVMPYSLKYMQIVAATETQDNFSFAASAAAGPYVLLPLYHGRQPEFNDSTSDFKELLMHFGVGSRTMSEFFEWLDSTGDWTRTDEEMFFTGDYTDYLRKGDYTLLSNSPLIG